MDVARPPELAQQRRRRQIAFATAVVLVVIVATVGLARLKPAAPTVESGTLWIDTVKRGTMLRQVRGVGVLVPDEIRWISALTAGKVERILVQPGTTVVADTILLELSNPQTEQEAFAAELALKAAKAQFNSLRADLEKDLLAQRVSAASLDEQHLEAKMQAEVNESLAHDGLVSTLALKQSTLRLDAVTTRQKLEQARLASAELSRLARLEAQQTEVEQRQAVATLRRNEALGLNVRAGVNGVLQEVPVQVGQQISPGTNLARVANPDRLKAQVQIAETQVKDIAVGQTAAIDTRNGVIRGHVVRIDPAARNGTVTVDVAFDESLPRGARPDMSIDGTIELERLDNILYVGRPAFGQEQSSVSLFKLAPDGANATLTPVALGRSSVNTIEVVRGLNVGDRVVLSDMSAWDGYDRVRLR